MSYKRFNVPLLSRHEASVINDNNCGWRRTREKYTDLATAMILVLMDIGAMQAETATTDSPSGQFSNTWCAISPAESLGLNRNSFVLPLTRMRRRFICEAQKDNNG